MLTAGADRDVSDVRAELRAHTQALSALRETQLEQAQEIAESPHWRHQQRLFGGLQTHALAIVNYDTIARR